MKYITSVKDEAGNTKHIIEISDKNVELYYMKKAYDYGEKSGERYYRYGVLDIYNDLTFKLSISGPTHLSEVVLAIELTRFVINHLKLNRKG